MNQIKRVISHPLPLNQTKYLVYVWLPGDNTQTRVLPHQTGFWCVWFSTNTVPPSCVSSSESILSEAALSFFKSILSAVEIHRIHLSLLPLNLNTSFHIPFQIWQSPSPIREICTLLIGFCMLCYVVVIFFLFAVAIFFSVCCRKISRLKKTRSVSRNDILSSCSIKDHRLSFFFWRTYPFFYRKKILWILLVTSYVFNNFIKCNIKLNN